MSQTSLFSSFLAKNSVILSNFSQSELRLPLATAEMELPAGHDVRDQRAADALHMEIIPGTEVMRDVEDVHFAHARGSDGAV